MSGIRELVVMSEGEVNLEGIEFKYGRSESGGKVRLGDGYYLNESKDIRCSCSVEEREVQRPGSDSSDSSDLLEWISLVRMGSQLIAPTNEKVGIRVFNWRGLIGEEGVDRLVEYLKGLSNAILIVQLIYYGKNSKIRYKTIQIKPIYREINEIVNTN